MKYRILLLFTAILVLILITNGLSLISATYHNLGNISVYKLMNGNSTAEMSGLLIARSKAYFSSALGAKPKNASSLLGMARLSILEEDLPRAQNALEQINESKNEIILWLLGDVLYRLGDKSGAIEKWQLAVPTRWIIDKGVKALEAGAVDDAIFLFENALDLEPYSANANYALGSAYIQRGEFEISESYLIRAVELNPGIWWYHLYLAQVYESWGRIPDAIEEYRMVLSLVPGRSDIRSRIDELEARIQH